MYYPGLFDHYEPGMVIKAAAGASTTTAQGFVGPVSEGYIWFVERTTAWAATQSAADVELFVINSNQLPAGFTQTVGDRAGRQDVSIAAQNDVSDNASPIAVPAGYYLVAFWSGLANNEPVQLSMQVCVHQLTPIPFVSPQDRAAEQLAGATAREHVALSHEVVGTLAV